MQERPCQGTKGTLSGAGSGVPSRRRRRRRRFCALGRRSHRSGSLGWDWCCRGRSVLGCWWASQGRIDFRCADVIVLHCSAAVDGPVRNLWSSAVLLSEIGASYHSGGTSKSGLTQSQILHFLARFLFATVFAVRIRRGPGKLTPSCTLSWFFEVINTVKGSE